MSQFMSHVYTMLQAYNCIGFNVDCGRKIE